MSSTRKQAVIEAPVERVWELVGNPRRHPEWFPRVIEVNGESFAEGEQYAQVTKDLTGTVKTDFIVERLDDMREIRLTCQATGMHARWLLTDAQGSTFVDVEMGMQPKGVGNHLVDAVVGRIYFRRWLDQSIDALRHVAGAARPAPPAS